MRSSHPVALRRSWKVAALAFSFAAGCNRAADPSAAPQGSAQVASVTRSFERRGAPGPWWREGATDEHFDRESRACLATSREARRRAPEDARADAAYRAFLDCMEQTGWRRGLRAPTAGLTPPDRR